MFNSRRGKAGRNQLCLFLFSNSASSSKEMLFLSFYAPIHHFSQKLLNPAHEDGHIVKKATICKKDYIGMKLGKDYQAVFLHVQNVNDLCKNSQIVTLSF